MKAFFGLVVGLLISLGLAKFAGESPAHVFAIISKSAFGTWEDLSQTLFYTTSLIFAGLSVSMAFPLPDVCFGVGSPMKNSVTPLLHSLGGGVM